MNKCLEGYFYFHRSREVISGNARVYWTSPSPPRSDWPWGPGAGVPCSVLMYCYFWDLMGIFLVTSTTVLDAMDAMDICIVEHPR